VCLALARLIRERREGCGERGGEEGEECVGEGGGGLIVGRDGGE